MSLSSCHGSRLPASAPGIWRPRLRPHGIKRHTAMLICVRTDTSLTHSMDDLRFRTRARNIRSRPLSRRDLSSSSLIFLSFCVSLLALINDKRGTAHRKRERRRSPRDRRSRSRIEKRRKKKQERNRSFSFGETRARRIQRYTGASIFQDVMSSLTQS